MSNRTSSNFNLPTRLRAKADQTLIAGDERHFDTIKNSLKEVIADLEMRMDATRRTPGGSGQAAMDRDQEVHRLSARLRGLRRFGLDLCLGHMLAADGSEPVYIGRLGLTDRSGHRLLIDWRSPAAEPFFGATHADPMGLAMRRRYHWNGGQVSDYWDEVFNAEGFAGHSAALDDHSAFLASLGRSRTSRMSDVLGTLQADQDAIIRASSRGALVVDGGPGTGKTVVALHRTAYLLYADPRLSRRSGGVLVVGPHRPYLSYVSDVLPNLGEEGVQTCTLRDLVCEGETARVESDPSVAKLKATVDIIGAIEPAVRLYEEPPSKGLEVETPWGDLWLSVEEWAEAFDAPDPGTPHNEARDQVWDELIAILVDKADLEEVPIEQLRRSLSSNAALRKALNEAWPLLEPTDLVGDLWEVPAYLRMCAPWLTEGEVRSLQRKDAHAWTVSDLPLLDAARHRLGDPDASRRNTQRVKTLAAQREEMSRVVEHLIETDDSEMQVMSMLAVSDAQSVIVDQGAVAPHDSDLLAGPFAHIVVDEAQELTDAEWQMLLRRCPSGSLTIVGDRAQARHGFIETWEERLLRVGLPKVRTTTLSINYRTPAEVMAEAAPAIRAALPDANLPVAIRHSGIPVSHATIQDLNRILEAWIEEHDDGIACVIGTRDPAELTIPATPRVRVLSPELVKGLEFDLVVVIDPDTFGVGIEGAVDRYVAMTRATQSLVILTSP